MMELVQVAYEAYQKYLSGHDMNVDDWSEIGELEQDAWRAAVEEIQPIS